jgi:hypothetical protein
MSRLLKNRAFLRVSPHGFQPNFSPLKGEINGAFPCKQ